ncbi:MAG: alginate lyase family protein [Armatimonadota bacterium]|nr:alginate lyase family protein [Armatimonadota bacterium]
MSYALAALAVCGVVAFPQHPRLLLSREGVDNLIRRISDCDWARACWEVRKKRADGLLQKKFEPPPRGGNWYHWYACPKHGDRLITGKQIGPWEWEHVCPVDKEVFRGDPSDPARDYDGCAIASVHSDWSYAVRDLGVAYQVTGDRRYANKAREILLGYAEVYEKYPLHTVRNEPKIGGGKVGAQSLDESVWLIPICQGADLIWDTLSEDERQTITQKLLLPAVNQVILPHKLGIHNIQCWKNSAVGLVGLLLGDEELVKAAVDDPERGYRVQMAKGVTADGQWWEGTWGYHFYTMWALWPLAEAARNCGIDLYNPELRRMFDAPLKFAMPNLRLPAFSDSRECDLKASRGIYELGYARYHDPAYLPLLHSGDRISDYAFWFGEPQLPSASRQPTKSANFEASGYAILTRGDDEDATWLCLKYGPYGGGHGHPDKLSFVLYSRGEVVAPDPGTAYYGLPIQAEWFRTSLAHNTLVIDETSQNAVDGKMKAFGSKDDADFVVADAGSIYDGVKFVRTAVLLNKNLLVVADQVSADRPRIIDIAYHQRGEWVDLPPGRSWEPPDKPGYKCLENVAVREIESQTVLATRLGGAQTFRVCVDAPRSSQLITAMGRICDSQERVPCAIVRTIGKESTVIWAIALDGKLPRIERLSQEPLAKSELPPLAFRVKAADGSMWRIIAGSTNPVRRW